VLVSTAVRKLILTRMDFVEKIIDVLADSAASFEPFFYGDYLWATTTQFVEFQGMESLRKPMRQP
jgi:hypothetical protein